METEKRGRDLAQLVRSCNERWTVSEMSERALREGARISPSELAAYAADEVDARPSRTQLRALAAALDVRLEVVVMAASRQFTRAPRARVERSPGSAPEAFVRDTPLPRRRATTRLRADGKRLMLARVAAGVALTLSCVALIYVDLLSVSNARIAVAGTIALTGGPVVFLAIRLVIYSNAHERRSPVTFWPHDRSTIVNWGLVLLSVNIICMALVAFWSLDDLVFDGRIGTFLEYFEE